MGTLRKQPPYAVFMNNLQWTWFKSSWKALGVRSHLRPTPPSIRGDIQRRAVQGETIAAKQSVQPTPLPAQEKPTKVFVALEP